MRTLRATAWLKKLNTKSSLKQRFIALFLLLGIIAGATIPTASAYALYRPNSDNSHIKKNDSKDPKKPMKQNYPGGTKATTASVKAAADAKPLDPKELSGQPKAVMGEALQGIEKKPKITPRELEDKRTATTSVSINEDGSMTEKRYFTPKHYKKDGKWTQINNKLTEDKNAGDSSNIAGRAWGNVKTWFAGERTFKTEENDWHARFAPSGSKEGLLRIKKGNSQVGFAPVNANKVDPVITTNKDDKQVVHYYDLWSGVDVEYIVESAAVKENIIIKNKNASNQVSFKVLGAGVEKKKEKHKVGNEEVSVEAYALKGALNDEFAIAPANLILNNFGFVSDQSVFGQSYENNEVTLSIDKDYLKGLPDKAFPAVIDPGVFNSSFGTRAGGNYVSFKSDGYICPSHVCNPYAGSLYDSNGWLRWWRGAFHAPYEQFRNTNNLLTNATLRVTQRSNESFWTGDWGHGHTYQFGHAWCLNNFNCMGGVWEEAHFGHIGDINLTDFYQNRIAANDFGAWVMIMGEDGSDHSFKNIDPNNTYLTFTYGGPPPAPSIAAPTANQVYVDPQASFTVNSVTNPNGSTPLEYEFLVSTGAGASGGLIASGKSGSLQWTVPDGILQDGSTYYIQARSFDPITQSYSGWGTSVPFRIDMRTGKDSTQTYDNLGPIDVDLATGNITTSATSHTSAALGGSLGVSLDYNTPLKSRNGLVGKYWNVPANYSGGVPTSTPNVTRVDQNVDFNWTTGSPAAGMNSDWFYSHWSGYFIAPKTGEYYFGGSNDDLLIVKVNNQQLYANGGCYSGACYGTSITLQEGQIVPISIEHKEVTGPAYARVFVKGAVDEQILPQAWLQTGMRPLANQRGLTGRYYGRYDGTNTFSSGNPMVMQRTDSYLNFDWGQGAPVTNGPADFLVRWTGYVTVPASGTYNFGSISDDGTKITVGTNNTVVYNDWTAHGPTEGYGTGYMLTANTPTPITIEYFDQGGPASFQFKVEGAVPRQIVPSDWLSPKAQVLPDGWNLGLDPDGNLNYDHLKVNQNSAVLTDSTGATHEYTWTGSGYKPPVNEDGQLVRNADGTFTMQDVDGRTYVFAQDGTLTSVTSPVDARKPAALQYEYQSQNGGPAHLYRIKDGVDPSRMATVYYSGDSECGGAPSGFDANAPGGMLCALKTNDGRATYFYYIQGQLARIAEPGNELTDYLYEAVTNTSGATVGYRMASIRDVATNDAVAASSRANDDNVKTQISYDILGRATSVTQPAATTGASRMQHTIEYLPGAKAYVDQNGSPVQGYHGMTKQHIAGATEPNGFTRRIKYDNLLRTIEDTDIANLTDKTEWDPNKDLTLSTTDETGLKSTTIYDDEDRPVDSYGPAPAAWYGADRKPLAAYTAQVPRTESKYDESIVGPAVTWHDYSRPSGNNAGVLSGAPKLHTTGLNPTNPGIMSIDLVNNAPITASSGMQGIGFSATGKLRLPNGTYWINADTSEGIRVWVDDILVLDSWQDAAYRSITGGSFTVANNAVKRLRIDSYRKVGSTGAFNVWMKQDFGFDWTTNWANYLKPGYSLTTTTKTYDSTLGDSVSTTNYGANPELGLPQSSTLDPAGLNLTTANTYEQQGATGSFLRQTSKNLPGNPSNNPSFAYSHYGATETRDNPCTPATEAYKQAGFIKLKTEADPDGAGSQTGRTTETVYDDAGKAVATRHNQDSWTCTSYDTRGRVAQTVIPAFGSEAARTITNNYAVWGDPLVTGTEDGEGSIYTRVDLLGRTDYYKDTQWNETWTTYDNLGRMSSRSGPLGDEVFVYDNYNRLIQQKLDTVTYAIISYDQYSRIHTVEYPNANGQKLVTGRDALGRVNSQTYYQGGGQTPGTNLVSNASVEQVSSDPNKPQGWQSDAYGNNTPSFTYLNEGYTGNRSVKAELTSRTDGDAKWYFDPVPVTGNTAYTFKDYYRSNTVSGIVVAYTHQNQSVTYEWIGDLAASDSWKQASLSFTTPATATQATVYHLISSVGWVIIDDAEVYQSFQSGNPAIIASDTVTRSQSGQILTNVVQSGANQLSYTYGYDNADRLTSANIGPHTFSYGFGAQDASCGASTNPNSGKNSNRTTQTIDGVTTTYCYDYADRLVSSSDPVANAAEYDSHGNMTLLGSGSSPLRMYYDSSDRNWGLVSYSGSGNGVGMYYTRDAQGRIVYREKDNINNWNWTTANQYWYGFTAGGDTPDIVRNANWDIVEKHLSLPGGVNLTIKPQESGNNQKQYSLPNIHGDTLLTTNAAGTNTSTGNGPNNSFTYTPFGSIIEGSTFPTNFPNGSYAYVGQHQKITETTLALTPIQMGARIYLPTLGRFTSVDPIEGGVENNYVYPPDAVNELDLDGNLAFAAVAAAVADAGSFTYSANEFRRKPSWSNAGWLATEFIPLVPGAGLVRGGAKAPKAIKAAPRAVKKVPQIVKRVKPAWKGREFVWGKNFRIAPIGGGKHGSSGVRNSWAVRLPHVHWKGKSGPRTSTKWHRPWQTTFRRWFR